MQPLHSFDNTNTESKTSGASGGSLELKALEYYKASGGRSYPVDTWAHALAEAEVHQRADELARRHSADSELSREYDAREAIYTDGSLIEQKGGPPCLG